MSRAWIVYILLVALLAAGVTPGLCGAQNVGYFHDRPAEGEDDTTAWRRMLGEAGIGSDSLETLRKSLGEKLADKYGGYESSALSESGASARPLYEDLVQFVTASFDKSGEFSTAEKRQATMREYFDLLKLTQFEMELGLGGDVDVAAYVNQVAECGSDNGYLNRFMTDLSKRDGDGFFSHKGLIESLRSLSEQFPSDIPRAVLYSVVLDRLTRAARADVKLFKLINLALKSGRTNPLFLKSFSYFERIKAISVDKAIDSYTSYIEENLADPESGINGLPLNIIEATWQDYLWENFENSRAGWVLTMEPPGRLEESTHAEYTRLSPDNVATMFFPPEPKLWNDLYSTWNMAFVSNFKEAPMFYAKLMNPQVLCYADNPGEYMFNRGMALQIHVHWLMAYRNVMDTSDAGGASDHLTTESLEEKSVPESDTVYASVTAHGIGHDDADTSDNGVDTDESINSKAGSSNDDEATGNEIMDTDDDNESAGGAHTWKNEALTDLWGFHNHACAMRYASTIREDRIRAGEETKGGKNIVAQINPMTGDTAYEIVATKYFKSNINFFRFAVEYAKQKENVVPFLREVITRRAVRLAMPEETNKRKRRMNHLIWPEKAFRVKVLRDLLRKDLDFAKKLIEREDETLA